MKVFYCYQDLSVTGPVWLSVVWPQTKVTLECLGGGVVSKPSSLDYERPDLFRKLRFLNDLRRQGKQVRNQVLLDIDSNEPNVLFVKVLNFSDVQWIGLLAPIWSAFDKTVLMIADTLEPDRSLLEIISKFDLITCFCGDLRRAYEEAYDVPTLYEPVHTDVLLNHSINRYRPIDLIQVGRRIDQYHIPIHRYFNQQQKDRIFVDFVTRTQTPDLPENEFLLLMSTYAKSGASICYEPSDVPRFRGRSPMTDRWVHAWASGCTVFGKRPTGDGVSEQMQWPESTIELPDDVGESIEMIEAVLDDKRGMEQRRKRNVYEALMRHDTRYRLRDIFVALELPLPVKLEQGLAELDALAKQVIAGTDCNAS